MRKALNRAFFASFLILFPAISQDALAELETPEAELITSHFQPVEPITGEGECGIDAPIILSFLGEDADVGIVPAATLSLDMFDPLQEWMEEVQKIALEQLGAKIVEIRNAADYVCRPRYGLAGARISQHAFGRAFDIYGFRLEDERTITLIENWDGDDEKAAFLREVEALNCAIFKTALGPNANEAHLDHFHLDLGTPTRTSHYCR